MGKAQLGLVIDKGEQLRLFQVLRDLHKLPLTGFNIWNMPGGFKILCLKHEDEYCIFLFFLIPLIVAHVD